MPRIEFDQHGFPMLPREERFSFRLLTFPGETASYFTGTLYEALARARAITPKNARTAIYVSLADDRRVAIVEGPSMGLNGATAILSLNPATHRADARRIGS